MSAIAAPPVDTNLAPHRPKFPPLPSSKSSEKSTEGGPSATPNEKEPLTGDNGAPSSTWVECVDPATNAPYYSNDEGQSRWAEADDWVPVQNGDRPYLYNIFTGAWAYDDNPDEYLSYYPSLQLAIDAGVRADAGMETYEAVEVDRRSDSPKKVRPVISDSESEIGGGRVDLKALVAPVPSTFEDGASGTLEKRYRKRRIRAPRELPPTPMVPQGAPVVYMVPYNPQGGMGGWPSAPPSFPGVSPPQPASPPSTRRDRAMRVAEHVRELALAEAKAEEEIRRAVAELRRARKARKEVLTSKTRHVGWDNVPKKPKISAAAPKLPEDDLSEALQASKGPLEVVWDMFGWSRKEDDVNQDQNTDSTQHDSDQTAQDSRLYIDSAGIEVGVSLQERLTWVVERARTLGWDFGVYSTSVLESAFSSAARVATPSIDAFLAVAHREASSLVGVVDQLHQETTVEQNPPIDDVEGGGETDDTPQHRILPPLARVDELGDLQSPQHHKTSNSAPIAATTPISEESGTGTDAEVAIERPKSPEPEPKPLQDV